MRRVMASLDSVSIAILLGAMLVMAGILSSLLALRFGVARYHDGDELLILANHAINDFQIPA